MEFLKFITIMVFAVLFSTCKKADPLCFSSPGKTVMQKRELTDFHLLSMHDNVDVVLVKSNINKAEVYAGEKVINKLTTNVDENGHLRIGNEAQCRFLKQRERINRVVLFYRNIDSILYQSVGTLSTRDDAGESTWTNPDSIVLDIIEGAGDSIRLRISTPLAKINYRFGTVPLRLLGQASVTYHYYNGYGSLDAWDLNSAFCYVESRSINQMLLNADVALEATVNGRGNIYYHGMVNDAEVQAKRKGVGTGKIERRASKP